MLFALLFLSIVGGAFTCSPNTTTPSTIQYLEIPHLTYVYGPEYPVSGAIVVVRDALYHERRPSSQGECSCPASTVDLVPNVHSVPAAGQDIYVNVTSGEPCYPPIHGVCIKIGTSVTGRPCGSSTILENGQVSCAVETRISGDGVLYNIYEYTHPSSCYCADIKSEYGMHALPDYTTDRMSMSMVAGRVPEERSPVVCAPFSGNVQTRTTLDGYVIVTVSINPDQSANGVCYGRYERSMKPISQFSSTRFHEMSGAEPNPRPSSSTKQSPEQPTETSTSKTESSSSSISVILMLISLTVIIVAIWSMATRKIKLD